MRISSVRIPIVQAHKAELLPLLYAIVVIYTGGCLLWLRPLAEQFARSGDFQLESTAFAEKTVPKRKNALEKLNARLITATIAAGPELLVPERDSRRVQSQLVEIH